MVVFQRLESYPETVKINTNPSPYTSVYGVPEESEVFMRKAFCIIILLSILLCSCQQTAAASLSEYESSLYKAQEISILSPGSPESIDTITDPEAIAAFVEALHPEEWAPDQFPDEAAEIGSFRFSQEKTLKFGQTRTDGNLYETAVLTLYDDSRIVLQAAEIAMPFKISRESEDYLKELLE